MKTAFSLASLAEVESLLPRGKVSSIPVVLEAHFSSFNYPLKGDIPVRQHLPGAIQIHPSYLEAGIDEARYYPFYSCPQDGNLLPFDLLKAALERIGVFPDTPVIVYGTEPDGPMAAARLIWGLLVAGVKSIKLLDGGLDVWLEYGGQTCSKVRCPQELVGRDLILPAPMVSWGIRHEYLATTREVQNISRRAEGAAGKLVDVRKPGEYNGTSKGNYRFLSKAGHIPNATLQGDWVNLVERGSHKIEPVLESVRQRWIDLGIVDSSVESGDTSLIFYCGTGWRSSLSFLVATLLGFRARNYDDGFYGWSWDEANPIEIFEGV